MLGIFACNSVHNFAAAPCALYALLVAPRGEFGIGVMGLMISLYFALLPDIESARDLFAQGVVAVSSVKGDRTGSLLCELSILSCKPLKMKTVFVNFVS